MIGVINNFNEVSIKGIMENYWGGLLAALTIGILSLAFRKVRSKLYPFLYEHLGRKVANFLKLIFNFIIHPLIRLTLIGLFLYLILHTDNDLTFSVVVFILSASLLIREKKVKLFPPSAIYSCGFASESGFRSEWITQTGNPKVDATFGKPPPGLDLKYDPNQATCSLVFLKSINRTNGIIEVDFNLERHGLLNILFFASSKEHKWYMARYDSRIGFSDGFVIKDQGPGNNWREFVMSGTSTSAREWFRARVEFDEREVKMYRDDILIASFENPTIFGSELGMFNEINDVHVDNFSISEKPFAPKKEG